MDINPLLGTGNESFWLGPRLAIVWRKFWLINEAHNGYLEVYLNLGLIGLSLLGLFLIASYQAIWKRLSYRSQFTSLSLALWTVLLFYNVTEAAFKGSQLMWLTFLLGAVSVSDRAVEELRSVATAGNRIAARFRPTTLRPTVLPR